MLWQKGGRRKPLVVCGTGKGIATLSLIAMQHGRLHDNEHCPVIHHCLPLAADSMQFVRPATPGASEERWSARARPLFRCILVNGSAPTPIAAMATIVPS